MGVTATAGAVPALVAALIVANAQPWALSLLGGWAGALLGAATLAGSAALFNAASSDEVIVS